MLYLSKYLATKLNQISNSIIHRGRWLDNASNRVLKQLNDFKPHFRVENIQKEA